jgi:hypothetical protein
MFALQLPLVRVHKNNKFWTGFIKLIITFATELRFRHLISHPLSPCTGELSINYDNWHIACINEVTYILNNYKL